MIAAEAREALSAGLRTGTSRPGRPGRPIVRA